MAAAEVPTAMAHVCEDEAEVVAALDAFGAPYVVKDDGLAAGKGVVVTEDRDEALRHAKAVRPGGHRGVPRRPRGQPLRDHRRGDRLPAPAGPGLQAGARRRRGPEHRRHGRLHAAAVGAGRPGRRGAGARPGPHRAGDGPPGRAVPGAALRRAGAHRAGVAGRRVQRPLRRSRRPRRCCSGSSRRSACCSSPRPRAGSRTSTPRAWRDGAAVTVVWPPRATPRARARAT